MSMANPLITFHSNKTVQTGPNTIEFDSDFTIPENRNGTIAETMAFDRKEYGMNSGIPFIKIANRVEVTVNLKAKRVGGPAVNSK